MKIRPLCLCLASTLALALAVGCDSKPSGGTSKPTGGATQSGTKTTSATGPSTAKKGKYEGGKVSDGGTISGKVIWDGAKPKIDDYPINRDKEFCDQDKSGKRASDRLVIGADGGVKNAVVYLDGIKKGKAAAAGSYELNQSGCAYAPHILVVPKGSAVSLKSSDKILHNIHMFGAATYNLPFPEPKAVEKKMRKAGVVRLQCDAGHGWMTAYMHITEHPYYVVTDDSGAYALADIPAGKYTVKMWHEHWKVKDTVKKDGEVSTYIFADPIELKEAAEVKAGATAEVGFTLKESS